MWSLNWKWTVQYGECWIVMVWMWMFELSTMCIIRGGTNGSTGTVPALTAAAHPATAFTRSTLLVRQGALPAHGRAAQRVGCTPGRGVAERSG